MKEGNCVIVNNKILINKEKFKSNKSILNTTLIYNSKNLEKYQYMCERNLIRLILKGIGIEEPLLIMRCVLYIQNKDFLNTGLFDTYFGRNMLNDNIPILGEIHKNLDWDIIDLHLNRGLPVLINADVFYLPYKISTYYQKAHATHSIALLSLENGYYRVLDWYHPDYFDGFLERKELECARTSENPRERLSAFSGVPIDAAYRLLNLDLIPSVIDIKENIQLYLYANVQSLVLDDKNGLGFIKLLSKSMPDWIIVNKTKTENVIQSLFLLDLELRTLNLYFHAMQYYKIFSYESVNLLLEIVDRLSSSVRTLKGKIILDLKRNRNLDEQVWRSFFEDIYNFIVCFCERTIKLIRE